MRLAADMVVGADAGGDIGIGAEALGIALQHRLAQRVDAFGTSTRVAFVRQPLQRGVKRFADRKMGRRAGGAGIGREIEQHDGQLALGPFASGAGRSVLRNLRGQSFGAFR